MLLQKEKESDKQYLRLYWKRVTALLGYRQQQARYSVSRVAVACLCQPCVCIVCVSRPS